MKKQQYFIIGTRYKNPLVSNSQFIPTSMEYHCGAVQPKVHVKNTVLWHIKS